VSSKSPVVRPYKWLAEDYDRHFTFHLAWYEAARQHILGRILPTLESACDLALLPPRLFSQARE
jgi:hypothetical protein